MKRNLATSLFLLLGTVAMGCAADAPGGDDDGTDPLPPDQQPVPLTPEGRFSMKSDFDVATNMPGTAGTVVNYFINATDDPDDPTKFIVEQVVNALPNGTIKSNLQGAIPFVAGYLNDRLLEVAPDFVDKIVDVGDAFGQVAKHFGTMETLEINATGRATKTVHGFHFKIDEVEQIFAFSDYMLQDVRVENIQVTLEQTGRLTVASHAVPLKFGALMKVAMNNAVIPMIDPSVTDLAGLLGTMINCQAVGQYVYEAIDMGSASTFESACRTGLTAGSNAFYRYLDTIDTSALEFNIAGTARAIDRDRDSRMDEIQTGIYTGELKYAGTPATMPEARFFGTKAM